MPSDRGGEVGREGRVGSGGGGPLKFGVRFDDDVNGDRLDSLDLKPDEAFWAALVASSSSSTGRREPRRPTKDMAR